MTPVQPTARARSFSLAGGFALLRRDVRRLWPAFTVLAAIWALAAWRVLGAGMPHLPVLFNWTDSLPFQMVYVDYGASALARGDYVVYAFSGKASDKAYPGLKNQPFFKRIAGVPGDRITVKGREVFINGVSVGLAKTHTFDRRLTLEPIAPMVIPAGFFYVQGTSADSFDSRYSASGLVRQADVASKVHPIF